LGSFQVKKVVQSFRFRIYFSFTSFLTRKIQMQIGYARVSSDDQNLDLQNDALAAAGCKKIYEDHMSGAKASRPGLQMAIEVAREGDVLTVWRLDRLGRSLKNSLERRGVGFTSLQEKIDTTSSGGRLIFHIFGALSEFERTLIRERTHAGLQAARARGRKGGRPKALDAKQQQLLRKLYKAREHTIEEMCDLFKISKPTLYNYLESNE
jgi:DNA invertase Pin-like site-specific DNA recombinase